MREKADEDSRRSGELASAKAKRVVEEGERRRAQIEAVIGDLEARRDEALQELQRLQGELASTIEQHKSGAGSRKRKDGDVAERSSATKPADPVAKS